MSVKGKENVHPSAQTMDLSSLADKPMEEQLSTIDGMDLKQIDSAQRLISSNYKQFARELIHSKLKRLHSYVERIDSIQQQLHKDSAAFERIVEDELNKSLQLHAQFSTEPSANEIAKRRKLRPEPSSPPPELEVWPVLPKVPIFEESFNKALKPFDDSLGAIKKRFELQAKKIEDDAHRNRELVWRQSIKDRIDLRNRKRQFIAKNMYSLQRDYDNVDKNLKLHLLENRYRSSVRKVGEKKSKSDLSIIVETPNLKRKNYNYVGRELNSFLSHASRQEINNDLCEISKNNVKVEKIEANYLYMEQPLKKNGATGPTTMTDLVNSDLEFKGTSYIPGTLMCSSPGATFQQILQQQQSGLIQAPNGQYPSNQPLNYYMDSYAGMAPPSIFPPPYPPQMDLPMVPVPAGVMLGMPHSGTDLSSSSTANPSNGPNPSQLTGGGGGGGGCDGPPVPPGLNPYLMPPYPPPPMPPHPNQIVMNGPIPMGPPPPFGYQQMPPVLPQYYNNNDVGNQSADYNMRHEQHPSLQSPDSEKSYATTAKEK